jgi:hypothetical protein
MEDLVDIARDDRSGTHQTRVLIKEHAAKSGPPETSPLSQTALVDFVEWITERRCPLLIPPARRMSAFGDKADIIQEKVDIKRCPLMTQSCCCVVSASPYTHVCPKSRAGSEWDAWHEAGS